MKTVLSGIALAAILALAMPTGADAANTHRAHGKSAHAAMSHAQMAHAQRAHASRGMHARRIAHKNMPHAANRHRAGHHYAAHTRPLHQRMTIARRGGGMSPTDNMANQLNRAENQRLMTGGSSPPMTGPNMAPPIGNPHAGGPSMGPMDAPNQAIQGR